MPKGTPNPPGPCLVADCDAGGRRRRNLCDRHYKHARTSGRLAPMSTTTDADRFWPKVTWTDDDHWLWQGVAGPYGHGRFRSGGTTVQAYRWAYEHLIGPIPAGLHLDHLCRIPRCVNPLHLEPVTPQENARRMQVALRAAAVSA